MVRIISAIFLVTTGTAEIGAADDAPLRSRKEFAAAMDHLEEGTPKSEVLRLLGKPDDIRTERDPGGISTTDTHEIWRYGTDGHLTTATLGQIYIDTDGEVQYLFGAGTPPDDDLFEEADLRELLRALDAVPSYAPSGDYDPLAVVRAVNLLQPLGKERALAAIREYLRIASRWHDDGVEGVFLVLRTLFDVPKDPGHMPHMFVGAFSPKRPEDLKQLPRYPVAIVDDLPLLVASGHTLFGRAERPDSHLKKFEEWGLVRTAPLKPSAEPFAALDKLNKSQPQLLVRTGRFLDEQVLQALDTVYQVELGDYGQRLPFNDEEASAGILKKARALEIRWDGKKGIYTLADGKTLPARKTTIYQRTIWRPKDLVDVKIEVIAERRNSQRVDFTVTETYDQNRALGPTTIRAFTVEDGEEVLTKFSVGGADAKSGSYRSQSHGLKLPEGVKVRVEMEIGKEPQRSPVFTP